MMQEEVESRAVNLAITTATLSMSTIVSGIRAYLKYAENQKEGHHIRGKQTVRQLIGQNQGVSLMQMEDNRIRDLDRTARKYGIDYAVLKDKSEGSEKYTIFFKAKDGALLEEIVKEYSGMKLQKEAQVPIKEQLEKFEAMAKEVPEKKLVKEPVL